MYSLMMMQCDKVYVLMILQIPHKDVGGVLRNTAWNKQKLITLEATDPQFHKPKAISTGN